MRHGCYRIKSRNFIVTNSPLSLHPLTKMKIIPFFTYWQESYKFLFTCLWTVFVINPSTQLFPFQSVSINQLNKAFRGHPGPWAELLRYMDFLLGSTPPCITKTTRYVPPQRVWFLHLFALKTTRTWRTGGYTPR